MSVVDSFKVTLETKLGPPLHVCVSEGPMGFLNGPVLRENRSVLVFAAEIVRSV